MSNDSQYILSPSDLHALVPKFYIYGVQGALIALLNLTIFLAIWRSSLIRCQNNYILISALALTDASNGLACFLAGVIRNFMIHWGTANEARTSLDCLLTPWNLIWLVWDQTYGAMLAAVSFDRLLMLSFPLRYLGWGNTYPLLLLTAFHAPYIPVVGSMVYSLTKGGLPVNKPAICYTDWIYPSPTFYHLVSTQSILFAVASVVIYGVVVVKYRSHKAKVIPMMGQEGKKEALKGQQRLTVTLGFSCCCTLLFHIAPLMVKQMLMWVDTSHGMVNFVIPYVYIIQNCNPLCNFGLYVHRQRDLRLAVKCLFSCKTLTQAMLDPPVTSRPSQSYRKPQRAPPRAALQPITPVDG